MKAAGKQDTVKVRITERSGRRPQVRYTAAVETPIERTYLAPGTTEVEFGPEHIASVYVPRPAKKKWLRSEEAKAEPSAAADPSRDSASGSS